MTENKQDGPTGGLPQDPLEEQLKQLKKDYVALQKEAKKSQRELMLMKKRMERSKVFADTRDSMNRALSAQRLELERYLNLIMDNFPAIVLLFDENNSVVYSTDAFLKSCHISAFALIRGKDYRQLLAPYAVEEFLQRLDEVFENLFEDGIAREMTETIDFAQSGTPRSYNIQISPMLGTEGVSNGSMVFFYDATDILQAQKEAERANMAKSNFLATVSHEIRTPINAVIGVSNILKNTPMNPQQLDYLHSIQNASYILLNLINDILDFSKIEAGKLELICEYFEPKIFLAHLESMFHVMFQQKKLDFTCEVAPNLPAVVYGDEVRIRQILTNLLNNALKYTEEGGVVLRVTVGPDGQLCFEVEDTGIGIHEEAQPKLFEAFEQLDLVRNKGINGTGLGLAITKELCDMMGGSIDVISTYGQGSTFAVSLPLRHGTQADVEESHIEILDFVAPTAKVLLVDDIDINLEITGFMLGSYEIKPDFASSGKEAVEKARAGNYDIIFMDHMMPEMDGVEATRILRHESGEQLAETPIVALTANAVSGAVEMFLENGFTAFLSKPVDEAALAECLIKWLPEKKVMYE